MSWPRTQGCAYRWRARTRRIVLWCGRLGRTQAETRHPRQYNLIMELSSDLICMRNHYLEILTHRGGEHTAAEPDGVSLHLMLDHLDLNWLGLKERQRVQRVLFDFQSQPPGQSAV